MKRLVCLASLTLGVSAFAQLNAENINSGEQLMKGFEAFEDENYLKAIEFYQNIPKNDTNYANSLYETGLAYYLNKDYQKALDVLEKAKKYDGELGGQLYTLIASSYDELEQPEKAIEIYTEAIENFGKDHNAYFNRGITYYNMEKYEEAVKDFQMAIHYNYGHVKSHFLLGKIAVKHKQYAQAILSLSTALYAAPYTKFAPDIVNLLEDISKGNELGDTDNPDLFEDQKMFEDINLLIKNQVALNKKYDFKQSLPTLFGRQLHLIANGTELDEKNTGFWAKHYLPMYKQIAADEKMDNVICYMLVGYLDGNKKYYKKAYKKSDGDDRRYIVQTYFDFATKHYINHHGKEQEVYINYEDGQLGAIGFVENDEPVGAWEYYNNQGNIAAEGNWSDDGKKEGVWKYYYPDGSLKETSTFVENEVNGVTTFYYKGLNLPSRQLTIKDGLAQDSSIYFYKSGDIKEIELYKDNELHGLNTAYYENGAVRYKANYKEGEVEGDIEVYFANGKLSRILPFKEGKRNGEFIEYHPNGKEAAKGTYLDGEFNGPFTTYYPDGTVAEEKYFKEGKLAGTHKVYYPDGTINEIHQFDESGKENGVLEEYRQDGTKLCEITIKKGNVEGYKYFKADGSVFAEDAIKGKTFHVKYYHTNLNLRAEGDLVDGERDGEWKFYNSYGVLSSIENFDMGENNGEVKEYYSNGKVKEKYNYKDGDLDGLYTVFNENGTISFEGFYEDGNASGSFYNYYKNGSIQTIRFYTGHEKHGEQEYYAPNNKLELVEKYEFGTFKYLEEVDTLGNKGKQEVMKHLEMSFYDPTHTYMTFKKEYKNNEQNGKAIAYFPSGKVSFEGQYVNGSAEGEFKNYHYNGQLSYVRTYENDELTGVAKKYYPDGSLQLEANYVDGERDGEYKSYYDNGKVDYIGNYKFGVRHGKMYNYNYAGELYLIRHYSYDVLIGYSYLGKDNKEVAMIPLAQGTGKVVTYFPNGKKALEQERISGEIEGKSTTYYSSGKVAEDEEFINTEYHNECKYYYPNGNLREVENYIVGDFHGDQKYYHSNGKLRREIHYISDEAFGLSKIYDAKGKVIRSTYYYNDEIITDEIFK